MMCGLIVKDVFEKATTTWLPKLAGEVVDDIVIENNDEAYGVD